MKKIFLVAFALFSFTSASLAQNENPKDPKAKTILDQVSSVQASFKTIYIEFEFKIENKANGINETQNGTVWIKGEKYKLTFPGMDRYSDGITQWTYLEDDDECTVSSVVSDDDEDSFSPASLLTIYQNGFNYVYGSEMMVNGKKAHMIKLFPEGGGKSYHTIKIYIDQASSTISKLEIMGKDGNTFTYNLKIIKKDQEMSDSMFVFDTSKAGDVVDLRD